MSPGSAQKAIGEFRPDGLSAQRGEGPGPVDSPISSQQRVRDQKLKRSCSSTRRAGRAEFARPKKGDVSTPL